MITAAGAKGDMMDVFQQIQEALQYAFIQRALIAGCFMALGCAFLGYSSFYADCRLSAMGFPM
jgi:hypothetical protein